MDDALDAKIADLYALLGKQGERVARIGIVLLGDDGRLDVCLRETTWRRPPTRERLPREALPALLAIPGRYAVPLQVDDGQRGYLCFDNVTGGDFQPGFRQQLDTYGDMVAALLAHRRSATRTMLGAVAFTRQINRHRDEVTAEHVRRVACYTRDLAETLGPERGLDAEGIDFLSQFAGLHDIGKIAIPDSILHKPGPLTDEEYRIAQNHVQHGVDMIDAMQDAFGLADAPYMRMLHDVVACHHERWNGSGYPEGLAGEAIPLAGRIVAVADVFDALTHPRHYKRAWSLDEGFAYLHAEAGRLFDPQVVAVVEARAPVWRRIHAQFEAGAAPQA